MHFALDFVHLRASFENETVKKEKNLNKKNRKNTNVKKEYEIILLEYECDSDDKWTIQSFCRNLVGRNPRETKVLLSNDLDKRITSVNKMREYDRNNKKVR